MKTTKMATYEVLTTKGDTYKWSFEECESDPNDYGNKMYISITHPSGDCSLLDCRYAGKYDFRKICVDWLVEYYGENLDELSEAE